MKPEKTITDIGEIKEGMDKLEVEGEIIDIGDKRHVVTKYGPATVATAILKDNTGQIKLSLWRNQIDKVALGDRIRLKGAFVRTFRDEIQLNLGKDGVITIMEEDAEKKKKK